MGSVIKQLQSQAGGMVLLLRVYAALAEDSSSGPGTHVGGSQLSVTACRGLQHPWPSCAHPYIFLMPT